MNTSRYIQEAKLHWLYDLKSYSQVHIPINLFCKNNTFFFVFDFFFTVNSPTTNLEYAREALSTSITGSIKPKLTKGVLTIEAGIKINKILYSHKSNDNVHRIMAYGWISTTLLLVPKENRVCFKSLNLKTMFSLVSQRATVINLNAECSHLEWGAPIVLVLGKNIKIHHCLYLYITQRLTDLTYRNWASRRNTVDPGKDKLSPSCF